MVKSFLMIVVITTIHKKAQAHKIGKGLLKERLIVCYNLVPIESAYWWKGKIIEENESLIVMKTKDKNFKKIEKYIKENSGYEVPELISIKPDKVNSLYSDWVEKEIS